MKNKFNRIFKNKKNIIIGAIHFPPLLGYPGFPGFKIALNNALEDLKAFERGGVDGIIIENNYDIPHKTQVDPQIIDAMVFLGKKIKKETKLPMGVSVLWNDFRVAFSVAKKIGAKFIRVHVFVDKVKTNYGIIVGNPREVINYQKKIKTQNIAIFADIQVKHAFLLEKKAIEKSAEEAAKNGSDALIVTGRWTGQAPLLKELIAVRKTVGEFPILVGSGADKNNIQELLKYADGTIVSTSLKEGRKQKKEVNVKGWEQRVDVKKVKEFIKKIKKGNV